MVPYPALRKQNHSGLTFCMRRSRKFFQRGVQINSDNVFFYRFVSLVDEEREDPNATLLKVCHYQHASEAPFCWRANDGPTLHASVVGL